MKKIQALFAAILCGLVFSVAISSSAQTAVSGYATIVRVEGMASYSLGDDQWYPLVAGKTLPEGAILRTGHNGVVDVVLAKDINLPQNSWQSRWTPVNPAPAADSPVRGIINSPSTYEQNVVRLTPNTTLGITKLTTTDTGADTVSDTELDLKQGKIFANVKKIPGASQYLIKLPSGIAGVRGTQFSIDVTGGTAVYESTGGGVVLSLSLGGSAPVTVVVGEGSSYDPSNGQLTVNPGEVQSFLANFFTALTTLYAQNKFSGYHNGTDPDNTCIYISPTHGNSGGHKKPQGGG